MLCPFCGHSNLPGRQSCANCGKPLPAAAAGEGERKLVTMLFADIVGSTAAAERLDPEDWREIVSGVHNGVSPGDRAVWWHRDPALGGWRAGLLRRARHP